MADFIYLDNHATTRVDPVVIAAMQRIEEVDYANAGSVSHRAGRKAAEEVERATASIAAAISAVPQEIVFTSGATESNNLAVFGTVLHPRQKRRKILSVQTEHRALLDPLERLARQGFDVQWLPVFPQGHGECGRIDLEQAASMIDDSTALVSVMLANNEIGVIQPLNDIAHLCRRWEVPLHTDATQGVGHLDIDVDALDVDLMSFSAHKFYGPKGVGGLFVRQRERRARLHPMVVGGGQQQNRRAGTLNTSGIVGMAVALERCIELASKERPAIKGIRDRLWHQLHQRSGGVLEVNGPPLESRLRLDRNLNCYWPGVEGASLMLACPDLCVSSGSACTSAEPHPSHVLQTIGRPVDEARCSLRFGIGRFNRLDEIEPVVRMLIQAYGSLRDLVPPDPI